MNKLSLTLKHTTVYLCNYCDLCLSMKSRVGDTYFCVYVDLFVGAIYVYVYVGVFIVHMCISGITNYVMVEILLYGKNMFL